jgi:hypothetical protein
LESVLVGNLGVGRNRYGLRLATLEERGIQLLIECLATKSEAIYLENSLGIHSFYHLGDNWWD